MRLDFGGLRRLVDSQDYRALFVTVSGAHLYGFPSPDSDIDLRGCHLLPLEDVIGLHRPAETIELDLDLEGTEVELVSHDVGKYFRLLVKGNGYILEQVFSPLVVLGGEFLERLRAIARGCITRRVYHHYRGFLNTELRLLEKQVEWRAKALLYAYRVLLTGIHMLRTGWSSSMASSRGSAPARRRARAGSTRPSTARTSPGSRRSWRGPSRRAACPTTRPSAPSTTSWSPRGWGAGKGRR